MAHGRPALREGVGRGGEPIRRPPLGQGRRAPGREHDEPARASASAPRRGPPASRRGSPGDRSRGGSGSGGTPRAAGARRSRGADGGPGRRRQGPVSRAAPPVRRRNPDPSADPRQSGDQGRANELGSSHASSNRPARAARRRAKNEPRPGPRRRSPRRGRPRRALAARSDRQRSPGCAGAARAERRQGHAPRRRPNWERRRGAPRVLHASGLSAAGRVVQRSCIQSHAAGSLRIAASVTCHVPRRGAPHRVFARRQCRRTLPGGWGLEFQPVASGRPRAT